MEKAIVVQGLGKRFRRYHLDRPWTLQEAVLRGLRGLKPEEEFWALRGVDLSVARGQMVGVIGPNGAGKSTLLRLIGGVGRPDEGRVTVAGRIGALIDLGAGFHPDLTGRENVLISGVIAGLRRQEVIKSFNSIVEFAELQEFIDSPLRTYSLGMQMRLAFAVAVHIQPSILLIDEVLAVGDAAFQNKCLDRIAQFKSHGCAILLISHDTGLVSRLCDEVLWLNKGQVAAVGEADDVVDQYLEAMGAETRRRTPDVERVQPTSMGTHLTLNQNRFGSLEMEITAVALSDAYGEPIQELTSGQALSVQVMYHAPKPIASPIFSVTISKEDGFVCYDTSTEADGMVVPVLHGSGTFTLELNRLDLIEGQYYVDLGVYERTWDYAYDFHWHAYPIRVTGTGGDKGIICPPHRWTWPTPESK